MLNFFIKTRKHVVWRFKVSETKYVKGKQYYEGEPVLRERVTSMTERPSVSESVTDRNHAPIGQK